MEIIDFFRSSDQNALITRIEEASWAAAKLLAKLLREGTFHATLGDSTVYLLMDGEEIVSFVTLTRKDCIADESLYPWLGFFFTFPQYRGHRHGGKVLSHASREAKRNGFRQVWLATDHVGLYEKYGFTYVENRMDVYGENSRIYTQYL